MYKRQLSGSRFEELLEQFRGGNTPVPGPQNGRFSVEPSAGLTSLSDVNDGGPTDNKSVSLAKKFNDTVKRIDGTDDTITIHWSKQ